uniref:CUB domain-containing protein n=1 Tax=Steinernema glaseri TaxID=37863 RepID=A0A1I8ANR0_9BILA
MILPVVAVLLFRAVLGQEQSSIVSHLGPQIKSSAPNCPQPFYEEVEGEIFSPNFPQQYDNGDNCTYLIEVDENRIVELLIVAFRTEACCDVVSIYDGDTQDPVKRLAQLSGNVDAGKIFRSTGNKITVHFYSDITVVDLGFYFKYASLAVEDSMPAPLSVCQNTTFDMRFGFVFSPNWPLFYPNSAYCSSLIDAGYGSVVNFEFLGFDVEPCCDFVTIFDGQIPSNRTQIAKLSGLLSDLKQTKFTSTGQYLLILFTSDMTTTRPGFAAIHYNTYVEGESKNIT